MWLWKKFKNTDIIGKIYILILLFIVIVATITIITRYNRAKSTNETIDNNVYENKISMVNEDNLVEDKKQGSQINNEAINNLESIEKKETTELSNTNTTIAKNENKSNVEKNTNASKEKLVKEEHKTQEKEVAKEETITQPKEEKKKQEQNYSEYEVSIAEKEECKNNNHLIATGNSNKWFETKKDADAYYNIVIAKYGEEWENDDSEDAYEKYLRKCPSRIRSYKLPKM